MNIGISGAPVKAIYSCDAVPAAGVSYKNNLREDHIFGRTFTSIPFHFSEGSVDSLQFEDDDKDKKKLFLLRGGSFGNIESHREREKLLQAITAKMSVSDVCVIDYFCTRESSPQYVKKNSDTISKIKEVFTGKKAVDEGYESWKKATLNIYKDSHYYKNIFNEQGCHPHTISISRQFNDTTQNVEIHCKLEAYQRRNLEIYQALAGSRQEEILNIVDGKDLVFTSHRFSDKEIIDLAPEGTKVSIAQ